MSTVYYKYHKIKKLHNLLFKTDEPFDWFVHANMRRMRAEEALTGEVMRRLTILTQRRRVHGVCAEDIDKNKKNPHFSMCRTFSPSKMKGICFSLGASTQIKISTFNLCLFQSHHILREQKHRFAKKQLRATVF